MRNILFKIFIILFGFTASCYGQDFATLWQGHYSYNNVVDAVSGDNKIYAAADNAIFQYDTLTNQITTITTIDGLSGQQITTIYYSEIYQYLIIGYETGLIEIYSETDDEVLSIVDILEKQNITPVNKRINHFYEYDGLIYISTDYGISIYDLERLEFGDTYFLGNGGTQISVEQTAILNDEIYAACLNNNGIKKADLTNPNLIDFQQWQTIISGNYYTMSTLNNKIYSVRSNRVLYEIDGTVNTVATLPSLPLDAEVTDSNLMFAMPNMVDIYNANLQLVNSFQPNSDFDTNFRAVTISNNDVYIGTSKLGVLKVDINAAETYSEILPNGPLFNNVFRLNSETASVWATFGDYDTTTNPYPLRSRGLNYYRNEQWKTIPYDSLFEAKNLSKISINPFDGRQVFISATHSGLLELNNFDPTVLYNQNNSGLEPLGASSIRITDTEFDREGLLWSVSSRIESPLKSYDPANGNWQSYSFSSLIEDPDDEDGFFAIEIDNNGTKWIGSYDNGLIAFNENISNDPLRNITGEAQNLLPFTRVISLGLDNNQQLWVGTTKGLRVLYNTAGFYDNPNATLNQIVILEDGIPKELLENQIITDIEIDGSNNKWIGTFDSGVFYFSPDGQNTIYHFTTDNSPLPTNRINDISIDPNNGFIYIATTKGLLSFKAGGSTPQETLEDAFAYPNPVRPEYNVLGFNNLNDINKGIKVSGLTERVNIKITDIEGNLVAEAQSNVNLRSSSANYNFAIDGGTAIWNGKNLGNSVVRSGVYLIMISDLDSFETKVIKVLIVR
ncbi:type IX secretion system anionic LPS delivery protein PorZ [Winogradskyella bathintestinalis]|uniref:ABC transporter substrate-binding protein n=1 Tax=Winogradskyella bathintestinalis TaxID=3035208 RepID=A0ABT7ZRX5_9FLAO|nr:ABC transporter substrate-binding protein [Winogradskyella bathintestinalis]MDN3491764.1 ABC transporter substrate-binding protein [Winogradskyella bathintestinalis]